MSTKSALELVDEAIANLEARLNLKPGQAIASPSSKPKEESKPKNEKKNKEKKKKEPKKKQAAPAADPNLPDICKLEIKVGKITKVWKHPEAEKLYVEEIDVGEEAGPRTIVSGLRPYYTEEEMLGHYLLVITNLKVSIHFTLIS